MIKSQSDASCICDQQVWTIYEYKCIDDDDDDADADDDDDDDADADDEMMVIHFKTINCILVTRIRTS